MHADFSVELGRDDAALELPWSSADPTVRYYDLKKHPEWLQQISEAMAWPELGAFLARINAAGFPLATAKCDAWASREVLPEEEIFGDRKFVSYIDLVFEDAAARCSFEKHEAFARGLCRLLGQAPEIPAAVEVVIRRCYYHTGLLAVAGEVCESQTRSDAGAEEAIEGGSEVETGNADATGEVNAAAADECKVETRGANGVNDAADADDVDEQKSGVANRESTDRGGASERTKQGAEIEHGMKYEGDAVAGQRVEADIEKAEGAQSLGETAADERIRLSDPDESVSGFCFTTHVTGFGDSDHEPRLRWQIALALLQNALVQLRELA